MFKNSEFIIPLLILLVLGIVVFIFPVKYLDDYIYYKTLKNKGIQKGGVLEKKGIGKAFNKYRVLTPGNDYLFLVKFTAEDKTEHLCTLRVSKNTYDVINPKDQLGVVYLPSDPQRCTLPNSLETLYLMISSLMLISIIFLLIFLGFSYYVYRSFKKPDIPLPLTTNMDVDKNNVLCPRCGNKMNEGYMPTIGGVSWRDRDEGVGIPTIFSGLPGTTFWVKRPMLHAFHCKSCNIITFKYGKKANID